MTKEEAIFCEKSYIGETNCTDCKYYGTDTCQSRESHKMAVKALEQELTTKNDVPDINVGNIYTCSCGYGWDKTKVVRHHFCPNCGKAVEPTTKENLGVDAISRAEVLKLMQDNWHTHNGDWAMQESMDDIRALPAVTPQEPRWIPVSEKLPNDRDWYLGIFKEPDTGWINPLPFICDYVGRETKATTKEHWILRGFTDWDDYHIDYYFNLECVAWMPLPKAYKAESEPQESDIEKRKPCTNYEDGCEEWAGCPCVHFKCRK